MFNARGKGFLAKAQRSEALGLKPSENFTNSIKTKVDNLTLMIETKGNIGRFSIQENVNYLKLR